jgi:transcriptional regulator with XRE-family HTH domain
MELSDRLTLVRKGTGMTQIPFSKEVGVSQSAYANYERGASEIPFFLAIKICKKYKISPSWFMLGEGRRKSIDISKLMGESMVEVLTFIEDNKMTISPERTALLVNYLFELKYSNKSHTKNNTNKFLNTI